MRQFLGEKKIRKLRRQTGLDIESGMVRGGTEHRVDLLLVSGETVSLFPNGNLYLWRPDGRLTPYVKTPVEETHGANNA